VEDAGLSASAFCATAARIDHGGSIASVISTMPARTLNFDLFIKTPQPSLATLSRRKMGRDLCSDFLLLNAPRLCRRSFSAGHRKRAKPVAESIRDVGQIDSIRHRPYIGGIYLDSD
jgi:hypothetical protein